MKIKIPENFPLVFGDPVRIQQILHNLIDNAIKFTDKGFVTVSAFKMNNQTYFAVKDTGRGIPSESLDLVFESFEQLVPKVDSGCGGKGLGLAISRYLVELHGGSVSVDSSEGMGSVFTFSLPISIVQELPKLPAAPEEEEIESIDPLLETEPDSAPAEESPFSIKKPGITTIVRVLAVDPDPEVLLAIQSGLPRDEFAVVTATSELEALGHMTRQEFDVALVDLKLGNKSVKGLELCIKIRPRKSQQELPILLLASRQLDTDLVRGIEAGQMILSKNQYPPQN